MTTEHTCSTDTPFCPICGQRTVVNEYIGQGVRSLTAQADSLAHDIRWAQGLFDDMNRKHQEAIREPQKRLEQLQHTFKLMREALEYARRNNIT